GGAYVPVDPEAPPERIAWIVEDTGAPVVLAQRARRAALQAVGRRPAILTLDDAALLETLAAGPQLTEAPPVGADQLVNIIYTSGTTGQPKGVAVEHRSMVAIADAVRARFFADRERLDTFSLTRFSFDIFGLEYALP